VAGFEPTTFIQINEVWVLFRVVAYLNVFCPRTFPKNICLISFGHKSIPPKIVCPKNDENIGCEFDTKYSIFHKNNVILPQLLLKEIIN
jgi:hypothetical protein